MVSIPAGKEVRERMRALGPKGRRDVRHFAFRERAHDDPEVAAVIVGYVRSMQERWSKLPGSYFYFLMKPRYAPRYRNAERANLEVVERANASGSTS